MKKTAKKLTLNRETLRRLNTGDLRRVAGQSRVSETSFCEIQCIDDDDRVSLANDC